MCSTRNEGIIFYFLLIRHKKEKKTRTLAVAFIIRQQQSSPGNIYSIPVAMLRTVSCSASLSSSSPFFRFFRHFPRSSTAALRGPSRNLGRISSPSAAGRRVFLRRGLRVSSAATAGGGGVNGQFSRFSVRAVATPSYPGNKKRFSLVCESSNLWMNLSL